MTLRQGPDPAVGSKVTRPACLPRGDRVPSGNAANNSENRNGKALSATTGSSQDVVPAAPLAGPRLAVVFGLFLASGAAALIYQVLWARELGLLFGSTAQAAALTIAIFFAGLAIGGWLWGGRAARIAEPLRGFGWLELGVALTALGFLGLLDVYLALEPTLIATFGDGAVADTLTRAAVATVVLLPPSILMGGTLPMLGQALVTTARPLGRSGTALYAVNTAGSALGALAAGFLLPVVLGYLGAYLVAVGLDLAVGLAALLLATRLRRTTPPPRASAVQAPAPTAGAPVAVAAGPRRVGPTLPVPMIWLVALASGVLTLAVEVVWTRLFSQVLQNSAYTYGLVLATFLLALALGAGVANLLTRLRRGDPAAILAGLLAVSAVAAASSPWLFHARTDGLRLVGGTAAFGGYIVEVAALALVVMLLPATVLGASLPYLLRVLQQRRAAPGDTIGRLVAVNTVGGIIGALAAGFVLLPLLGAWRSLLWVAGGYAVLTGLVLVRVPLRVAALRWVGAAVAALAAGMLLVVSPDELDVVRLAPDGSESLVAVEEGPQATVSVVADRDDLFIRVDNHYTLGGTRALDAERNQSVVPLLATEDPRSVFYLGMGTGITAGAGLAFDVDRVVVCELIDEVVQLAEAHFTPWTNGLFHDPRAEVRAADGRTCLRRSTERYDVIISDLFTPWEAGTGNLYTSEHYATARQRLEPGGAYVQWVPLYQVTDRELVTIGATMDAVFDEVTVWRGDLYAERSIVALVGRDDPEPLDPAVLVSQGRQLTDEPVSEAFLEAIALRMYVGNLTASGLYRDREHNTDRHPVVEYGAPISQRDVRAGRTSFVVGPERERFYAALEDAVPLAEDPLLARLDERQRGYVAAGRAYSRFRLLDRQGRDAAADRWLQRFLEHSPEEASGPRDVSPARRLLPRLLP